MTLTPGKHPEVKITQRAPTMRQVAARAGVSVFTVSAVVNSSANVLPHTREQVLEAMRELDYQPNHAARSLNHAKAFSVAFVSHSSGDFADLSMGLILSGMTERLGIDGYHLVIHPVTPDLADLRRALMTGRLDGAILAAMPAHPLLEQVSALAYPLVFFDQPDAVQNILTVCGPYRKGIMAAVAHLAERGRKKVAFVGGPPETELAVWHNLERYAGFRVGCEAAGLTLYPELLVHTDYSIEDARWGVRGLLECFEDSPFDAVVCASDRLAVGTIIELQAQGKRVPEDFAVTGFDNFEYAHCTHPALTTIHFPVRDLGFQAADLLLGRITGTLERDDVRLELPMKLVVRSSS